MLSIEYITIFLLILGSTIYVLNQLFNLKRDNYLRIIERAIIKKISPNNENFYFNEYFLKCLIAQLLRRKKTQHLLADLAQGHCTKTLAYLKQKEKSIEAVLLDLLFHQQKSRAKLERFFKTHPHNQEILIALAELYFLSHESDKGLTILSQINLSKASVYARGIYWLRQSELCLREGDMLSASQICSRAEKSLLKSKAYYAVARSQLLMGTIYRVCFVEDVASFMFRAALSLYQQLRFEIGQAVAYGNLGILNSLGEHFAEAEAYFNQAKQIYQTQKSPQGQIDIDNQLGLLALLRHDYTSSQHYLSQSHTLLMQHVYPAGMAMNQELFSYLKAAQNQPVSSRRYAHKASELYYQLGNFSAYFESLYLQAEAYYAEQKDSEAELILRQIIDSHKVHCGNFHLANAYSLLGLIFMRHGELQRAKGLFQQSLSYEQKNDRLSGQACDYANIGLLELRCGHQEEAQKHIQEALFLAQQQGREDMASYLQQELNKLKV